MKAILYSVCIGSLALALTGAGAQAATDKNKRQEKTKPQQRSANVQAARPATAARPASAMPATARAQRNVSAAQTGQQRSYTKPRTSSTVNRKPVAATPSSQRIGGGGAAATRNSSVNPNRNAAANRDANVAVNRTRNVDVNRERNVAVKTQAARPASTTPATVNVNRFRNTNEFRNRNNIAINRNVTVNRTQNAAFYRGRNVTITNNWHGDAFRGQRYSAFRNYNRQWHDRSWWRSHYTRIIFVNSGWWYWNAGYWFPAWGFAPSVSYVYDGPIYGYNGLSPDQVTVNVQEQLAAAGYYDGPIDGVLGPMTREAIAAYQADNGLAVTSAIDEPTLATMGLV
jgi:Putative peptidoglycan binding domain